MKVNRLNAKILLTLLLGIFSVAGLFAQPKGHEKKSREEMRKEIDEFKKKFIAQEIDLKDDQKKEFFELYTQMNNERMKVFEQTRALERKVKKNADASEADYKAVSKAITEAKEKDAEIEKKYDAKFSKFLTSKQIYKMKSAEEKFRNKMQEMWHKKRPPRKK